MKLFGLDPTQASKPSDPSSLADLKSLPFSMVFGAIGFATVSLIAYSIWAFRLVRGEAALYASIAIVYLALSGLLFGRLLIMPDSRIRFAAFFAAAFLAYAIAWCVFWFGLSGHYHADLWGSAAGLLLMATMAHRAFGAKANLLASFAILFTFHSLGYYLGEELYASVGRRAGRLLWGAAHGLGFGAGIGALLHQCQGQLLERVRSS